MLHVLTVAFIALKLTGVIAWSWWLVFLPTLLMLIPVLVLIARRVGTRIYDKRNKGGIKVRKNLIVKIRMKSGKEHYLESRSFENGHLKEFVEDVESFRPVFLPVDGDNLVRWSEIESLADVSHL